MNRISQKKRRFFFRLDLTICCAGDEEDVLWHKFDLCSCFATRNQSSQRFRQMTLQTDVQHKCWAHVIRTVLTRGTFSLFATVSGLKDLFPGHGVQWCILRCFFSCLVGVSEVLSSQLWPGYKPRRIKKTCTRWIQWIVATLASHSRAFSAPLLPVK